MNLGFDAFGTEQLAGLGGIGGGGGGGAGKSQSSSASATSGNNFGGFTSDSGGLTPLAAIVLAAVALFGFLGLVLISKR